MNFSPKVFQAARLASFILCLAGVFNTNSAWAFIYKIGKITLTAQMPDGTRKGGFATYKEVANFMCVTYGKPNGAYPPHVATVEAEMAGDPWIGSQCCLAHGLERQPHELHIRPDAQSRDAAGRGPYKRRRDDRPDPHDQHRVAHDIPVADADRRAASHHHFLVRRRRHHLRRPRGAVLEDRTGD